MVPPNLSRAVFSRRSFLVCGTLFLAGSGKVLRGADSLVGKRGVVRIGVVTDLHYADKEARGQRHYRDTLPKLVEAVEFFNRSEVDLVVELGDLIDKANSVETEIAWLRKVDAVFSKVHAPRHYVLGNHCVATLTKEEFRENSGSREQTFYSWEAGNLHLVILDACFTSEGQPYGRDNFDWKDSVIPAQELDWLKQDLAQARKPVVVFAHQRLDPHGDHSVRNAAAVRKILEASGKVTAVFQGHSHENDYACLNGIHYCTLVAMVEGKGVENSGYGILDVFLDGSIRLHGLHRQVSRVLEKSV